MSLEKEIEEFLLERGALRVGIATRETLAGGPPSADLTYVLPQANSAISFALPLDREKIRAYLSKRDHCGHETDNIQVNIKSSRLAKELAQMLEEQGFASRRVHANLVYRTEVEGWQVNMYPDLSHRYVAVRSGVGYFGWSGNVGLPGYGTAVILGTVVTEAKLIPTDPLPSEESFCDRCKLCLSACASGMVERKAEEKVTLGGMIFSYGKRKSYMFCQLVCGGFTGLHPSGKWSTWSPGRYRISDNQDELFATLLKAAYNYQHWPERKEESKGYTNPAYQGAQIRITCGNCQLICWGNPQDTRENYQMLKDSGCVLQKPDGSIEVLGPEEASAAFEAMDPAHRDLYW